MNVCFVDHSSVGQFDEKKCCVCVVNTVIPIAKSRALLKRKEKEKEEAHELCESRGGRPGLPSLINLRFLWT